MFCSYFGLMKPHLSFKEENPFSTSDEEDDFDDFE